MGMDTNDDPQVSSVDVNGKAQKEGPKLGQNSFDVLNCIRPKRNNDAFFQVKL